MLWLEWRAYLTHIAQTCILSFVFLRFSFPTLLFGLPCLSDTRRIIYFLRWCCWNEFFLIRKESYYASQHYFLTNCYCNLECCSQILYCFYFNELFIVFWCLFEILCSTDAIFPQLVAFSNISWLNRHKNNFSNVLQSIWYIVYVNKMDCRSEYSQLPSSLVLLQSSSLWNWYTLYFFHC